MRLLTEGHEHRNACCLARGMQPVAGLPRCRNTRSVRLSTRIPPHCQTVSRYLAGQGGESQARGFARRRIRFGYLISALLGVWSAASATPLFARNTAWVTAAIRNRALLLTLCAASCQVVRRVRCGHGFAVGHASLRQLFSTASPEWLSADARRKVCAAHVLSARGDRPRVRWSGFDVLRQSIHVGSPRERCGATDTPRWPAGSLVGDGAASGPHAGPMPGACGGIRGPAPGGLRGGLWEDAGLFMGHDRRGQITD